jgi:hypothetical protein
MVSKTMERVGPGIWHVTHTFAAWATTPERRVVFCTFMRTNIQPKLPCGECRGHAAAYIEANPPEKSPDPLIWSWEFHNAVNRRLGKPEMEWDTCKKMYADGDVLNCNQGCGDSSEDKVSGLISQLNISDEPKDEEFIELTPTTDDKPTFATPTTVRSTSTQTKRVNDTFSTNRT